MPRLIALFGGIEVLKIALYQSEVVPSQVWEILGNFPELTIFLVALYYTVKWLDRVYGNNQKVISALIEQAEHRQDQTDGNIKDSKGEIKAELRALRDDVKALRDELQILRATVSEVAKVDDVIDRLMEKIGVKNDKD